jgi:hypothetical protein
MDQMRGQHCAGRPYPCLYCEVDGIPLDAATWIDWDPATASPAPRSTQARPAYRASVRDAERLRPITDPDGYVHGGWFRKPRPA